MKKSNIMYKFTPPSISPHFVAMMSPPRSLLWRSKCHCHHSQKSQQVWHGLLNYKDVKLSANILCTQMHDKIPNLIFKYLKALIPMKHFDINK
jgi:hypothetical protein